MPLGGLLSLGGSALAIGGGLAGLFGNNGPGNITIPQPYQFQNMGAADSSAFSGIGNLSNYNTYAQNLPQYQSIAQGLVSNPYAGNYQGGAGVAGAMGQGAGANAYGAGGNVLGAAAGLTPDISALISMGFDPQSALYNQTLSQVQNQQNVANAQNGLAGTPYGAGITDQNLANFNMQWQNQQLGRAAQAAQGASGLLGSIGQGSNTGAGLQAQGANTYLQGSGVPYSTYGVIGQGQLGALGSLGQYGASASNLPQQQIQDYLGYLSGGQASTAQGLQAAQLQLQQQQQGFQQNMAYGTALGAGLFGLGNTLGGNSFFGGGGGMYGNAMSPFGSSPNYGGGNVFSGDAFGGTAANPLAGLSAEDYA